MNVYMIQPDVVNKWIQIIQKVEPLWEKVAAIEKSVLILNAETIYQQKVDAPANKDEEVLIRIMILWRLCGGRIKQTIQDYLKSKDQVFVENFWQKWADILETPPNPPYQINR